MDDSQFQAQSAIPTDAAVPQWRQGYQSVPGAYDEMFSAPDVLRPHWKPLIERLDRLDSREISRRWEQGRRLIHENGVTYNVYGDPKGMERPWDLDAIPFLIAPDEWYLLEAALIQRARLLNLILADIYGPQALLRAGLLSPELVLAHPGFLRPCHGLVPPHRSFLDLYSADLVRGPD